MKINFYLLVAAFIMLCTGRVTASISIHNDSIFNEIPIELETTTGKIAGTLTLPLSTSQKIPVALLIAGSGPTDRNGNQPSLQTDTYKQLAHVLSTHQIASLRFDKRGIAASWAAGKSQADLRFEDYINDAAAWVELLKKDKRFSSVVIIGHSEGSLIGMVAGRKADQYISVAGAGESADKILKKQFAANLKPLADSASWVIDSLKAGKTVNRFNIQLLAFFIPSIQPYLISWFKYDPQQEIKKLSIPILIIQGTNDLQISVADAKELKAAQPQASLVLINNMNHVLKKITGDVQENQKSYHNPSLPIDEELVASIVHFINRKGTQ